MCTIVWGFFSFDYSLNLSIGYCIFSCISVPLYFNFCFFFLVMRSPKTKNFFFLPFFFIQQYTNLQSVSFFCRVLFVIYFWMRLHFVCVPCSYFMLVGYFFFLSLSLSVFFFTKCMWCVAFIQFPFLFCSNSQCFFYFVSSESIWNENKEVQKRRTIWCIDMRSQQTKQKRWFFDGRNATQKKNWEKSVHIINRHQNIALHFM